MPPVFVRVRPMNFTNARARARIDVLRRIDERGYTSQNVRWGHAEYDRINPETVSWRKKAVRPLHPRRVVAGTDLAKPADPNWGKSELSN